jgi:hypothetical protein
MEFVVADLPSDHPDQRVSRRIAEPVAADIRCALFDRQPIHHGTHFILVGGATGELTALCTSGPWAAPDQPGEFLLMVNDELVSERASREQALNHLLAGLDG